MMTNRSISNDEFKLLRDYIEQNCGIALGDEKAYLIETRLTKLMALNGCETFGEFYQVIKNGQNYELRDKIIDAMTTNETLWFRDRHPFSILKEVMLPYLREQFKRGRREKIRIWSAASSTGQEAYSISIAIHEFCAANPGFRPEDFEILGTDISASAIFIATAGRYDSIAMDRGMPAEFRDKYFKQDGRVWCVNDTAKKIVKFQKFNLQDAPRGFGQFDIIFLRYVAIYFSTDFKKGLFERLASTLKPPGFLFIGAVESLRGVSDTFQINSHAGGYFYALGPWNGGKNA